MSKRTGFLIAAVVGVLVVAAGASVGIYYYQKKHSSVVSDLCANVKCDSGKACDPTTGQCVADCTAAGAAACPEGTTCNPATKVCEKNGGCETGLVYNPTTDMCEVPAVCPNYEDYKRNPETNTCDFLGTMAVTDVSYLVDGTPASCPSGSTVWWNYANLKEGTIIKRVIRGCKKMERIKDDKKGITGFSYTRSDGGCPSGAVQDTQDLLLDNAGKFFTCKTYGLVSDPWLFKDIDAVNVTKGEACVNLGPGWHDNTSLPNFNEGEVAGNVVRGCYKLRS
jgi:hypothetical protein